ncbi:MAG: triose-phosphate isomerase [Chitinophagaceae bacterium]|nr:triose-phosphate isomerase [Chitinophagaceae bacterium]
MKRKIIVANWKMNPVSSKEALILINKINQETKSIKKAKDLDIIICPPAIFLSDVSKNIKSNYKLGAQDIFWQNDGSFTGEISPKMLKEIGVSAVIVGHSERRGVGDSDEIVAKKLQTCLANNLTPIICVGEKERDSEGKYFGLLANQLKTSLSLIKKSDLKKIVIAYEPIWAIGKKEAMNSRDINETTIFLKKTIVDIYGKGMSENVSVIYGGSVNFENIDSIMKDGGVNGVIIGRQSLIPSDFSEIVKIISKI